MWGKFVEWLARKRISELKADKHKLSESAHNWYNHSLTLQNELDNIRADILYNSTNLLDYHQTDANRAKEALKPFVAHYQEWMDKWPDESNCTTYPIHTHGDIRKARIALGLGDETGRTKGNDNAQT